VSAIKEHLNQRAKRDNVIEIGVGLGDILLDLEFKYLVGADKNTKCNKCHNIHQ
jgi:hypothetical protein